MSARWFARTGEHYVEGECSDQWDAYDLLKDINAAEFGAITMAGDLSLSEGDHFPVRSSYLFGVRWGKPLVGMTLLRVVQGELGFSEDQLKRLPEYVEGLAS